MTEKQHDATFYVRIKANRYLSKRVAGVSATALTQSKPGNLTRDTVAVKLTVRLPEAVFDALTPEAVVIVPAELVQHAVEVQAEAGDPS